MRYFTISSSEILDRVRISTKSYSHAVQKAIKEIHKKKKVHWFQVLEQRGHVLADGVIEYQVILRIGV
ncbi:MAG: dodecin family protein [Candidatus Thermoplasmatota archaeon]|nr:dodecin family protein [Candidatus Thermoplasmatota archaeon]